MNKKLIVSDIDGTLLRSDKTISNLTQLKIKHYIEEGHGFAIATGRMHPAGKIVTQQLDYDGFLISCNGAVVKHLKTDEVIQAIALEKSMVEEVVNECRKYDAYFHLYTIDTIYAEKEMHLAKIYADDMSLLPDRFKFEVCFMNNLDKIIENNAIYKIGIYSEVAEYFQALKNHFRDYDTIEACVSLETSFDIMAKGVNKATGIKALESYYHIDRENVIAFGDNENDVDMIEYAGIGVAMENATDLLKEKADFVTKKNDEDGIVFALEKFLENK